MIITVRIVIAVIYSVLYSLTLIPYLSCLLGEFRKSAPKAKEFQSEGAAEHKQSTDHYFVLNLLKI